MFIFAVFLLYLYVKIPYTPTNLSTRCNSGPQAERTCNPLCETVSGLSRSFEGSSPETEATNRRSGLSRAFEGSSPETEATELVLIREALWVSKDAEPRGSCTTRWRIRWIACSSHPSPINRSSPIMGSGIYKGTPLI